MKTSIIGLGLLAILLQASTAAAKVYRQNVITYGVSPDAQVTGDKIEYSNPDCEEDLDCRMTQTCRREGTVPTLTKDKTHFACCHVGQDLLGSPDTAFDCCAHGHDLAGSAKTGYRCCPAGFEFDGDMCKQPEKVCKNGKKLVDGHCVCPEGTVEAGDGTCKPNKRDDDECSSGLESGKCYTFTSEVGHRLGLRADGNYYAAPDEAGQRYGKFKLCLDEACTGGRAVNPSDKVYIKDMYGNIGTGANNGQWLNKAANGAHITRTNVFANAGQFSLSKWPCGKYCLGGFDWGVGPACPATIPALTFYPQDPQMCIPFELTEVPCDIKSDANNCLWTGGDQCCNKVDCRGRK